MKKRRGFTIAELIIVVAIITVITAFGINTYRNQMPRVDFNNAISKIISMVQTARSYAMTSRAVYDPSKTTEADKTYIPPEGYGVYIDKASAQVILFANTKADTEQNKNQYNSGQDLVEETYKIPSLTSLLAVLNEKLPEAVDVGTAVIIFRPPLAEAFISNNGDPAITLNLIDTLRLKMTFAGAPNGDVGIEYIRINKTAGFPELE